MRTMTFGFGFCSLLYGSGSVLNGKTWVLVLFLLAGFGVRSHL